MRRCSSTCECLMFRPAPDRADGAHGIRESIAALSELWGRGRLREAPDCDALHGRDSEWR
eukprot:5708228-Pyramimonas_sp.AAC.1